MRFIGSKVNLLCHLEEAIRDNISDNPTVFMDIFSGTGTVAEYFKKDYRILSNDSLYFSYILQKSRIENNKVPKFTKLAKIGIDDPLSYLEREKYEITEEYFITHQYSPYEDGDRMYFTIENASRIDFIRLKINEWKSKSLINEKEFAYLLAALIEAVPFISNISGTYGAYLKHWDKRSLGSLKLQKLAVMDNHQVNHCFHDDANSLIERVRGDILYIDPPYNSRQYISNYHLLETIARYDYPEIYGKTGLRPYESDKSLYCSKKEIAAVFEDLIQKAKFRHIFVSYSTEGLLLEEEIEEILKRHGLRETYSLTKVPYRKYKSKHKQEESNLNELIFYIQKDLPLTSAIVNKEKVVVDSYKRKEFVKSPLNYIGGKYKLLNQIIPLFPDKIDTFVDLFAGGLNVGINVQANQIIANDMNKYVIEVLETMKTKSVEEVLAHIYRRIEEYQLSKSNEDGFKRFRDYYNQTKQPLDLYTLICYSFNYQFRFNNNQEYNNPFGRERSQFSPTLKAKLVRFIETLHGKNIQFDCKEFDYFDFSSLGKNDLVYCDPPYLITTGSYNDGNRGFKDWNDMQEKKLLQLLDSLHEQGVRFALSNVLSHKGIKNDLLLEWAKSYHINYLQHDYANSSHNTTRGDSEEVLITNFTD